MKEAQIPHVQNDPPAYSSTISPIGVPTNPPGIIVPRTTVITTTSQPTVVTGNIVIAGTMSPVPSTYVCQSCNQMIVTRVEKSNSMKQHLFALLLCGVGLWPCVCIPYCMDSCKKADHYCTSCGAYIGTYTGTC